MCGHGAIALGAMLVETGRVAAPGGAATVTLETPAGLVSCRVASAGRAADLGHDPQRARVLGGARPDVEVPGLGPVALRPGLRRPLLRAGGGGGAAGSRSSPRRRPGSWRSASGSASPSRRACRSCIPRCPAARGLLYVQFYEPARRADAQLPQRGGGGARGPRPLALRDRDLRAARQSPRARPARGRGGVRPRVHHRHALHRADRGAHRRGGHRRRWCPEITGRAWMTARATLSLDPSDPFPGGFLL